VRGRQVFSSSGDITRTFFPTSPRANLVRAGRFAWRSLLNRAVSGANTLARALFARWFPSDCGPRLENLSRLPLCPARFLKMQPISGRTCCVCREQVPGAEHHREFQTCRACQETAPCFAKATAYGAYQSELPDRIRLLKYEGVLPPPTILVRKLAEATDKLDLAQKPTLLVPVPLHLLNRRQRGFNRSEIVTHAPPKKFRIGKPPTCAECVSWQASYGFPDWTHPPSTPCEHRGSIPSCASKWTRRTVDSIGGRRPDHRNHRFRVRPRFAASTPQECSGCAHVERE
jgi:hypothetical protein